MRLLTISLRSPKIYAYLIKIIIRYHYSIYIKYIGSPPAMWWKCYSLALTIRFYPNRMMMLYRGGIIPHVSFIGKLTYLWKSVLWHSIIIVEFVKSAFFSAYILMLHASICVIYTWDTCFFNFNLLIAPQVLRACK